MYPVSTTIAIWSVNSARSQKPPPNASATAFGLEPLTSAATRDHDDADQGEDVGVGEPLLGPPGDALGEPGEPAFLDIGVVVCVMAPLPEKVSPR